MTLHNKIMNIQVGTVIADQFDNKLAAYKVGHRDARHVAAELSLQQERYLEAVEDLLLESIGAMLGGKLTRESDMGKDILENLKKENGFE